MKKGEIESRGRGGGERERERNEEVIEKENVPSEARLDGRG